MNRSEISQALAKALAYAQCGKQADAEAWARTAERVHLVQLDSTGMWRGRDDDGARVGYWATRSDAVEELTGLGYVLTLQNAIGSTWELGPQYRGI